MPRRMCSVANPFLAELERKENVMIDRRTMLGAILAALPVAACSKPAKVTELLVYKSPHCGCCSAWVDQMKTAGLPLKVFETELVSDMATKLKVPENLRGCHTAVIDGFFIEGHVPAADISKLLRDRPKALGLAVPGMPIGSPGMEQGDREDAFNTLIVGRDGSVGVFARHNQTASR